MRQSDEFWHGNRDSLFSCLVFCALALSLLRPYCLQFWRFLPCLQALRSLEGESVSCNFLCTVATKCDSDRVFVVLFFLFEAGLLRVDVGIGLFCLCLLGAGITCVYHHAWLSHTRMCVLACLCPCVWVHASMFEGISHSPQVLSLFLEH